MLATVDIETKTFGSPDSEQDEIQLVGIKPYGEEGKIFLASQLEEAKAELKKHRIIAGYNINNYDIPILERYKLLNKRRHIFVDLFKTIKDREQYFPVTFTDKSLKTVLKVLNLPPKTRLPVEIFQKSQKEWTDEEYKVGREYLLNDLFIEEALWMYFDKYFHDWKEWLEPIDVAKQVHITASDGVFTYKAICKEAGLKEEYGEWSTQHSRGGSQYEGGLVVEPTVQEAHGNIICLDFASMYPHAYIQGNLYSHGCKCCTKSQKWHGNKLFPIKGYYCTKKRGRIEEAILRLYKLRQKYKAAGDRRQYAIKIMINTMYGINGNPSFKNVFNINTASDCTLIGRNCLKYARDRLEQYGYKVLYSDTDSCYILDDKNNEERVSLIADCIVQELKAYFPFPTDTFNLKIDDRIKHIWFFKQGDHYKKKHYAYTTKEGVVVVKGLPIVKRDASKIGQLLLTKYVKPMLKEGRIKKSKKEWRGLINEQLVGDVSLAGKTFRVHAYEHYKDGRCLSAMISSKYGPGKHFLIPNKKFGVGKGTRYCTIEEFENEGLMVDDLILNKTYGELREFTEGKWEMDRIRKKGKKHNPQCNLFEFS